MEQKITNLGQAINILVQVATLAQSKGILTLNEAAIVKESIDFINELQTQETVTGDTPNDPMTQDESGESNVPAGPRPTKKTGK